MFKTKPKAPTGIPRPLKQGTQIGMVDVNEEWVQWARDNLPREPKFGHVIGVALWAQGQEILVLGGNGGVAGRINPRMADLYIPELIRIQSRGYIGTTDAFVKWEGSKTPHAVCLNWSERAASGGGIL